MTATMKAYAYASEEALLSILDLLRGSPIVFATASLQSGFEGANAGRFLLPSKHAGSVNGLLEAIAPGWYGWKGALTRLRVTNSVLRDKVAKAQATDRAVYDALLNGRPQVLRALEMLVEAGLTPAEYGNQAATDTDKALVEVWSSVSARLEQRHHAHAPAAFRAAVYPTTWNKPEQEQLLHGLRACLDMDETAHIKRLVLAGFYFVSPVQYQLFCALAELGIELIFLNYFDAKQREMFEVWERTFGSSKNCSSRFDRLPTIDTWQMVSGEKARKTGLSERFYARFTGTPDASKEIKAEAIRFESPIDMVRNYAKDLAATETDGEGTSEGERDRLWFTRGRNEMRDLVSTLDPNGSARVQSLHHTPAGSFLLTLHDCWEQGKIAGVEPAFVLTRERFRALMMSGFLQAKRPKSEEVVNGRDLVGVLDNIFEALHGVDEVRQAGFNQSPLLRRPSGAGSVTRWRQRLGKIKEANSGEPIADCIAAPRNDALAPRFVRYLENPNRFVSHFRVTADEIDNLLLLVGALEQVATRLAQGDLTLGSHLEELKKWLTETAPNDAVVTAIVQSVDRALEALEHDDTFHASDLSEALRMMLGDKPNERSNSDSPSHPEERVKNFAELDFLHAFPGVPVHVGHLDAKWVPTATPPVAWPLARETLEQSTAGRRLTLSLDAKANSDLFLFYSALAIVPTEDLELSWCEELGTEVTTPSPFLLLLELQTAVRGTSQERVPHSPQVSCGTSELEGRHSFEYPIDAAFIYSICPRRYVYDFVLNAGPTYRNAFQQLFAMGPLLLLRQSNDLFPKRLQTYNRRNLVGLYAQALGDSRGPEFWNAAAFKASADGARAISQSYTPYPVSSDHEDPSARLTHRAVFRMLLLPTDHDDAWNKWRRDHIGFEPNEKGTEVVPPNRGGDQRLSEFLNAYWDSGRFHRHEGGREVVTSRPVLNGLQREKSIRRVQDLRSHRDAETAGSLPNANTGDWCRVCPHSARCPRSGIADPLDKLIVAEVRADGD